MAASLAKIADGAKLEVETAPGSAERELAQGALQLWTQLQHLGQLADPPPRLGLLRHHPQEVQQGVHRLHPQQRRGARLHRGALPGRARNHDAHPRAREHHAQHVVRHHLRAKRRARQTGRREVR